MAFNGIRNKTVLVTGAPSGIGRAVAVAFAEHGARVAINHLGRAREAAVVADMAEQAGGAALVVEADVSDRTQVRAMVADDPNDQAATEGASTYWTTTPAWCWSSRFWRPRPMTGSGSLTLT